MAHLLIVTESHPTQYRGFEEWIHSLRLKGKDGKELKVVPREVRMYDLVYPEETEAQLLDYLKELEYSRFSNNKLTDIAKKFIGLKKVKLPEKGRKFVRDWWMKVNILGKVEDKKLGGKEHI